MILIPAIDVMDGKCVRLSKGDFERKTVYGESPLEAAKGFEGAGIKRLHIVDLDGANGQNLKNLKTLEVITNNTSLIVDFGGGIKKTEHLKSVFDAGASMVSLGSVIVKDFELFSAWILAFGPEKFLPGADVLENKIRINGWKEDACIDIFDFIKGVLAKGINKIFCTDILKDGMMQGPAVKLYKEILHIFPFLNLIASGGVASYEDLSLLKEAGCKGVIIGKAIYEGRINLKQIETFTALYPQDDQKSEIVK